MSSRARRERDRGLGDLSYSLTVWVKRTLSKPSSMSDEKSVMGSRQEKAANARAATLGSERA